MIHPDISKLFDLIQRSCPTPVWSQGTKLFRMGIVEGVSETEAELEFRLHLPGGRETPCVVLYPLDEEWECDCDSPADTCAHVAAAIIALKQAREEGNALPRAAEAGSKMAYRFCRCPGGLMLNRIFLLADGGESLLIEPLYVGLEKRTFPHGFRPAPEDLAVDRILGRVINRPGPLNPGMLRPVLERLRGKDNIFLDGEKVSISDDPLYPDAAVENHGERDIVLSLVPSAALTEVLAPGVGLSGELLVELGEWEMAGTRWEKLPFEVIYAPSAFAELAASVIPELQKRLSVEIYSERLPEMSRFMQPRLTLATHHSDRSLSVLPELVYGNPPHVRIVDDKMVYLQNWVPVRDRREERRWIDMLRDDLNMVINRKVQLTGKDAADFMERVQSFSERVLDSSQQPLAKLAPLSPVFNVQDDVFTISFVVEGDDAVSDERKQLRFATAENVLSAWREGLSMAPLDGGGWAPIPKAWLAQYGHMVADILTARFEDNKVAPSAVPILAKFCGELNLPPQPCFDRLRPLIEGFETIPEAVLPPGLTATLRGYQRRGADWLMFLKGAGLGGILADDMGLGKTVQTLAAVNGRTLVVAPTSVIENWAIEIRRFRPDLKVGLFHGPKRTLENNEDIVLTTYGLLRNDLQKLCKVDWHMVVLDEAQNIKNPTNQAARAAFKLRGKFHLALSGTPVENRLDELWSIFHFCNPGLLGTRSGFQKRFADPMGIGSGEASRQLRERIAPFVLRRMKQDVAPELPQRSEQTLHCDLDDNERRVYDAVRATTCKSVVEQLAKGKNVMAALEALLRLRQCACHVSLVPGHQASESSKLTLLLDRLTETVAEGHKALVFSQWTSFLDLVEPQLKAAEIPFIRLDGTTRDRGAVVARFQTPDGPKVMLISLKAGGTGLNLTEADHVFLLDPWWNPAVEDQAADRTHRIGQTKPVMVYRLVARDTVEERILSLQQKKRLLADAALGEADRALSITKEDLLALLA